MFPDNTSRDISPQDDRDFITTAFPYMVSSAPGPNNDRVDTAGIGAFFDFGSHWFNLADGSLWYCKDGQPTAAVWVQIGGPPAPFSPILARITSGPQLNRNLQSPLIHAAYSSASNLVIFTNATDTIHLQVGTYLEENGGTEIGFVESTAVNPITGIATATLSQNSVANGPGNLRVIPFTASWVEQRIDPDTGLLTDDPTGIVGDLTQNCLFNMATTYLDCAGTFSFLFFRATIGTIDTYQFSEYVNPEFIPGASLTGPINLTPPTAGPPVPPTAPGTFTFDPVLNVYILWFNGLVSVSIPASGASQVTWQTYDVVFSQFTANPQTIDIATYTAGTIVLACVFRNLALWTFMFSGTAHLNIGYRSGAAPNPTNTSLFGTDLMQNGGTPWPIENYRGGASIAPFSPNCAGNWILTGSIDGFTGAPTTGKYRIWVLTSNPPL
jgi:hypothetical protein